MISYRAWSQYPATYRERELETLVNSIIVRGASGSVAGLPGTGKSNLLGFLCHRPDVLQTLLAPHNIEASLVPIDLNNLADNTNATFYRVILRSFYEVRDHFEGELRELIIKQYEEHKTTVDPFVVQSALRELLSHFRVRQRRVGFIFDRVDDFYLTALPQMTHALRGLRDSFKDILFYIMGMRQEAAYFSDPAALGELYEILDTCVFWVGPMSPADARLLVMQETHTDPTPPTEDDLEIFMSLTGGFPSLLKAVCSWWLATPHRPEPQGWQAALLHDRAIQHRLERLLDALSQEELLALSQLQKPGREHTLAETHHQRQQQHQQVLRRLAMKGLCAFEGTRWCITSSLLAAHLGEVQGRGRGRIWLDEQMNEIYQGDTALEELTPLEQDVLNYLLRHPRTRHTKEDLIENVWPDKAIADHGVSDDSLYQVIRGLRRKIEPVPKQPSYLLTWRGRPGGYQFFPEGRPK